MSEKAPFKGDAKLEKISDISSIVLFVVDEKNRVIGSLTDNDVRRGLIKGISLSDSVKKIMTKKILLLKL